MRYFVLLFLSSFFQLITVFAVKNDSSQAIRSYKLSESIKIDGVLNESVYSNPAVANFIQKDPDEGKPATEKTEVWISNDEFNIYFSGRFSDSNPDSIDVTLMRRDNFVESDWLWIYLDPYNDDRTGFYFAVNPGGSICDGTLYNDGDMDESWDGVWENKTTVDDKGWNVEIRIPFTQLRFQESEKMIWGVNLNRDIKRKHEMSFYVMVPKKESGFISKFADIEGLDGIKPKQRFEILPYIVQKAQYLVHDENDPFYKSNKYTTTFGADLKFSIGSNLNTDATINPDFGQVEVDPAIINLSAFETFYEEKRPFFIEGSNIFIFGYGGVNNNWGFNFGVPELFYSRRIGRVPRGNVATVGPVDYPNETRILGAVKLSGKIDESWTIGALSSLTERTFATIQLDNIGTIEEEVEPLTHYGVFRAQKEFNSGKQAIGMIFTTVNRDLEDENLKLQLSDQAYTIGLDGWTFLDGDETYVMNGSVIGSFTHGTNDYLLKLQNQPYRYMQRPDKTYMQIDSNRTSISGYSARIMLNKQKGNFYVNAAVGAISPGFEYNDLGSQWLADKINGHLVMGYRWFEPDGIFRTKNIYLAYNRTSDYENNVTRSGFYFNASGVFLNFWGMRMNGSYNSDYISTTLTRGGPKLSQSANFSFYLGFDSDTREKIIVSPFAGYWRNKIGITEHNIGVEFEWKPSSQISFSFEPEYYVNITSTQWVGNIADPYATRTYDTRYVFADLNQKTLSANIRLNWIFTPSISLQFYIQPLFAVGDYENYKELTNPPSLDVNQYGHEDTKISYDAASNLYTVDPDADGPAQPFSFGDPNFNFKSLRGNLVLRWEVFPGSVFYFAWTNNRVHSNNSSDINFINDFNDLINSDDDNIFLVKFSYWINL